MFPTAKKTGHWRPRRRAAAAWSAEDGPGKSMRRAGTDMRDWVMALPGEEGELGLVGLFSFVLFFLFPFGRSEFAGGRRMGA